MKILLQILWGIVSIILVWGIKMLIWHMVQTHDMGWVPALVILLWIIYSFSRSLPLKTELNYKTYIIFSLGGFVFSLVALIMQYFTGNIGDIRYLWGIVWFTLIMLIISAIQWKEEFRISIKEMLNKDVSNNYQK